MNKIVLDEHVNLGLLENVKIPRKYDVNEHESKRTTLFNNANSQNPYCFCPDVL